MIPLPKHLPPLPHDLPWFASEHMHAYATAAVLAEREQWVAAAQKVFGADDKYGTGFYNREEWLSAYEALRKMCARSEP